MGIPKCMNPTMAQKHGNDFFCAVRAEMLAGQVSGESGGIERTQPMVYSELFRELMS